MPVKCFGCGRLLALCTCVRPYTARARAVLRGFVARRYRLLRNVRALDAALNDWRVVPIEKADVIRPHQRGRKWPTK